MIYFWNFTVNMKKLALLLVFLVPSLVRSLSFDFNTFCAVSGAVTIGIYVPLIINPNLLSGKRRSIAKEVYSLSLTAGFYALPILSTFVLCKNWNSLNHSQKLFLFASLLPGIYRLKTNLPKLITNLKDEWYRFKTADKSK
jgi:hypothetical protein